MDNAPKYTSLSAYRELELGDKQRAVKDFIWSRRGHGSTEPEANAALHSPHAQKRFAELEDSWFIRRTEVERINPSSGMANNVFIGTPNVRAALTDQRFELLFAAAAVRENDVTRLQCSLRAAIELHEEARRAIHVAVWRVYGREWGEVIGAPMRKWEGS